MPKGKKGMDMPFKKRKVTSSEEQSLPEALGFSDERAEVIAKKTLKIAMEGDRVSETLIKIYETFEDDKEVLFAVYVYGEIKGKTESLREEVSEEAGKITRHLKSMLNELKEALED